MKAQKVRATEKRGCPTCDGVDPKSCMRCYGKTRFCDWFFTTTGWSHVAEGADNKKIHPTEKHG